MWPNPLETADLVTFAEEILDRKLHFLCSAGYGFADVLTSLGTNMKNAIF